MEQDISANAQEEYTGLVRNAIPLYFGEQHILSSCPSVSVPTTSTLSEWLFSAAGNSMPKNKNQNKKTASLTSEWTCSPSSTVMPTYFLTVFPSQFRCYSHSTNFIFNVFYVNMLNFRIALPKLT